MKQSETIVIDPVQKSGHVDKIEIAMTEEERNDRSDKEYDCERCERKSIQF
jgi:hypothetical protein